MVFYCCNFNYFLFTFILWCDVSHAIPLALHGLVQDMVVQELKQAQEEATKDRLKAQESEQELSAKLVSLQAMYQTALQQQQQLR